MLFFNIITEVDINQLVGYYKEKFHGHSFTPKLHLLHNHISEFMRRTGLGLGTMSEHGGEQLHQEFNDIGRKMHGARNTKTYDPDLQHLASTMEEHLIRVYPDIREVMMEE